MMEAPCHLPLNVTSSVLIPAVFPSNLPSPGLRLAPLALGRWGGLCQCPTSLHRVTQQQTLAPGGHCVPGNKRVGIKERVIVQGGRRKVAQWLPPNLCPDYPPSPGPPPTLLPPAPEEDGGKRTTLPTCPSPAAFPLFVLGSLVPSLSSRDLGEGLPQASLFEAHPCPRCWEWPWYPLPGHLFWF